MQPAANGVPASAGCETATCAPKAGSLRFDESLASHAPVVEAYKRQLHIAQETRAGRSGGNRDGH